MTGALGPNFARIGKTGSRWSLATPALVLDRPVFLGNIATMKAWADAGGCVLRPHIKGPKNISVAKILADAGGSGVACSTLFEAEIMVGGGISDLLLTSPVATRDGSDRLARLAGRAKVAAVVDGIDAVTALQESLHASGTRMRLLVDVDVGQRRTGVTSPEAAAILAVAIDRAASIDFGGLQAYWGHLQGIPNFIDRKTKVAEQSERLQRFIDRLRQDGLEPATVSGAGTGTAAIDARSGLFSELQPGSFPFMDAAYEREDIAGDGSAPFAVSLFIHSTVVSANQPDQATLDAGMKAIPVDGAPVRFVRGAPPGAQYAIAGDEFGFLIYDAGSPDRLRVGDQVIGVTPHCDSIANLHALLHVVEGDELIDIWPIDARGRW